MPFLPNPWKSGWIRQNTTTTGPSWRAICEKIYSDSYYRKNKPFLPLLAKITRPKSYDRFLIQAEACLNHDAYAHLPTIAASTLVVGGKQDHALGCEASREMAQAIPDAQLKIYPQWGHGLYEEAPDFNQTILNFLR